MYCSTARATDLCLNCLVLVPSSSEPAVPGDEEEVAAASPEPEPEVEKEAEAAVVELKPETLLETQTDTHTADDQTEKSPTAAPPTAEPAAVPAEPAPAAPEGNRVSRMCENPNDTSVWSLAPLSKDQ